ncbi:hypothetical protein GUJ93_ZPchr0007g6068 [Zizania palustris]|uniref:Uncharacterized protein n=1 Tax=Zizania palustris TaxID=103762 RepID=A0A8J5W667_ZIZPA|nr:hypothetical protein GUJ93_ZPchr0007g6068 [Zizania palustris]
MRRLFSAILEADGPSMFSKFQMGMITTTLVTIHGLFAPLAELTQTNLPRSSLILGSTPVAEPIYRSKFQIDSTPSIKAMKPRTGQLRFNLNSSPMCSLNSAADITKIEGRG